MDASALPSTSPSPLPPSRRSSHSARCRISMPGQEALASHKKSVNPEPDTQRSGASRPRLGGECGVRPLDFTQDSSPTFFSCCPACGLLRHRGEALAPTDPCHSLKSPNFTFSE